QTGLVLGAVRGDHGAVHGVDVGGVHAGQRLVDDGIDVLHSLGHALAAVAGSVAVPQLQGLEFASGSAAGGRAPGNGAVGQADFRLYGGIAAGVNDLAPDDLFDLKIAHKKTFLSEVVKSNEFAHANFSCTMLTSSMPIILSMPS